MPTSTPGSPATPDFAGLKLIEIHREDIESLPALMALLRDAAARFIVFCDDLSFDGGDASYKSLKAALEGGVEGRPANVLFYATSNRRHLLPRDMMDNERSTAINPGEAVEEKVSLSDRFGLWLGFHKCSQDDYLAMVFAYVEHFGLAGAGRADPRRSAGMGDYARVAFRPRGISIYPGSGGAAGPEDRLALDAARSVEPRQQTCPAPALVLAQSRQIVASARRQRRVEICGDGFDARIESRALIRRRARLVSSES